MRPGSSSSSITSKRWRAACAIPVQARLQTATISGLEESMKDAVQFKFLPAPLNESQLKELIQIVPGS